MNASLPRRHRVLATVFLLSAIVWTWLLVVRDPLAILGLRGVLPRDIADAGHWDKLVHGGGYLGLMLVGGFAFGLRPRARALGGLLLVGAVHGAAVEVAQWSLGSRHGDVVDWFADMAGLMIGFAVVEWRRRRRVV